MSRLPDARLDLVSNAVLETLLMAHATIANCVRNCPASGVISNVTIPALNAWAEQMTSSDPNPSSVPAQYGRMLLQIETSDDHHCKAWQALGQSPRAEDRLWAAIALLKLCGEPQTVTVRVGIIVTVKAAVIYSLQKIKEHPLSSATVREVWCSRGPHHDHG